MLNVVVSMSTARRLAAGLRISLGHLAQGVFLQFGLGQQPLEPGILLAQLLELLSGIGVHPAVGAVPVVQRRRRHTEFGGDLLASLPLASQLVRTAQFAHDVFRGMPLLTSHDFIVPFGPASGHRTLKVIGLIPGEDAKVALRDKTSGPFVGIYDRFQSKARPVSVQRAKERHGSVLGSAASKLRVVMLSKSQLKDPSFTRITPSRVMSTMLTVASNTCGCQSTRASQWASDCDRAV
jgi:hypothetical protein